MQDTTVALKTCTEYTPHIIDSALQQCFDLLGGLAEIIKPNHKVLIKPDLYCATAPDIAKTSHPNIVSVLAEQIAKIGAKCIIADSPKGNFSQSALDKAYIKTQMLQVSNDGNATLNVNDQTTIIANPNGEQCRDIYVMDAINDADIIVNVGKLRCDKYLGLAGCSQNLFGLVPGKFKTLITSRCNTIQSYCNYIIDLYETLEDKIIINILDGIVGCESNNDPRILNSIIVGKNPFAVDALALKTINQDINSNTMLTESVRRNKFELNFNVIGDNFEPLVCSDFNYEQSSSQISKSSTINTRRKYNSLQKRPSISAKLCKGCNVCINNCPMKAITIENGKNGKNAKVDYTKCISCFKCVDVCPYKIAKTKTPLKYKSIDKIIKKSAHIKK
jgi:uncharacterized protein (DUF362 family)